jgi:IPT/TIG domain
VTNVQPGVGFAIGGTSVTITGGGFTGATQVDFGRVRATKTTVDSDTEITATSPSGPIIGTVDVTVVTPRGRSATSPADEFSYHG